MKDVESTNDRLSDLVLKLLLERKEGKAIQEDQITEVWDTLQTLTFADTEVPLWADTACMSYEHFRAQLLGVAESVSSVDLASVVPRAFAGDSEFLQDLDHSHSVDDPPYNSDTPMGDWEGVDRDQGPDRWGYLHKDPNGRGWLPWPTNPYVPEGQGWTDLGFSWIYACKTDPQCIPDDTGGLTRLFGRFRTSIDLPFNGFARLEIKSSVGLGPGTAAWVSPLIGYYTAAHKMCISIDASSFAWPWNQYTHHASREVWRHEFQGRTDEALSFGGDLHSVLEKTVPVKGPTEIQVVEQIEYTVNLEEGALIIPYFPAIPVGGPGVSASFDELHCRFVPLSA